MDEVIYGDSKRSYGELEETEQSDHGKITEERVMFSFIDCIFLDFK